MSVREPSSSLERNPSLLCAYHALEMCLFPMAVITLFWAHQLGLSMTQIMELQAIFGGTVAWRMVEPSRRSASKSGHWDRVRWILRFAARDSPRLRAIIFFATVLGLSSFIPVWLIALYARDAGVPVP